MIKKITSFSLLIILWNTIAMAKIIKVPQEQSKIQYGILAAENGDSVLVSNGTYYENLNFLGRNVVVASNFLFSHDTTDIEKTIIDGNTDDIVIKFESGEDSTAALIGFTIRNGINGGEYFAAGIKIWRSSPSLINLIVTNNIAAKEGGGISITDNDSTVGTTILKNMRIENNHTDGSGGGIYIFDCDRDILMENVHLVSNEAYYDGGGMYIRWHYGKLIMKSTDILGNKCNYSGGGLFIADGVWDMYCENILIGNNQSNFGGGILSNTFCNNTTFVNAKIFNNFTNNGGSAIIIAGDTYWNDIVEITLINSTIVNNKSNNQTNGTILCQYGSILNCYNTIFWHNDPPMIELTSDPSVSHNKSYAIANIKYSNLQFGKGTVITKYLATLNWLDGNISADPKFVNLKTNDFRLDKDSPCIDAGNPDSTSFDYPLFDLLGNKRIVDGNDDKAARIDIGAYEYVSGSSTIVDKYDSFDKPTGYNLYQNYPNPFNPSTTISYGVPKAGLVHIAIYDVSGRLVQLLANGVQEAGFHSITWNGQNEAGNLVASGIYICRLTAGEAVLLRKLILTK
jgi:hypothetical protein